MKSTNFCGCAHNNCTLKINLHGKACLYLYMHMCMVEFVFNTMSRILGMKLLLKNVQQNHANT